MAIDPSSAALAIGGIDFGSNILGAFASRKTAKEMIDVDLQNLAFQKSVLDYQQSLQRNIFSREDTAIQRRVADLKAAGLSPVLAAGQGARAGQAINVTAPQRSTAGLSSKLNAQMEFASRNAMIGRTVAEAYLMRKQADQIDANIRKTDKQTDYITEQIAKAVNENKYLKETLTARIDITKIDKEIASMKRDQTEDDRHIFNDFMRYTEQQSRWHAEAGEFTDAWETNPKVLEWRALKLQMQMKRMDYDFYKSLMEGELELGSPGSLNAIFRLLSMLVR